MAKYQVLVDRFDGGLNTKISPLHGPPNQSPSLQNVVFGDWGTVQTRKGYDLVNPTQIDTEPIYKLVNLKKDDGTEKLVAVCGESPYYLDGTTFDPIPSGVGQILGDVNVHSIVHQDQAWFSNGTMTPYKYNGTEWTQWGTPAPDSTAQLQINSDGTLTGDYKYVYLGVNSNGVQGNYCNDSLEISPASQDIAIKEIATFPVSAGVNTIDICRTKSSGTVYYVLTNIANATSHFTDNISDTDLITLAPTDNGQPPNLTVFIHHNGYFFGASHTGSNPTYLYYSNINDPEIWGSDDFIRIGDGDGYPIRSLATFGNHLIIGKDDGEGNGSVWMLYTPDGEPANWQLVALDSDSGSSAARAMAAFSTFMLYLNRNGIYSLNVQNVGSTKADLISSDIEPDILEFGRSALINAAAKTWENKVWLSIPYGSTQSSNNRVMQYDYVRGRGEVQGSLGAWSRFTNMTWADFAEYDGDLYAANYTGSVYKLEQDYNDAGSAIDSYYYTMSIRGQEGHEQHTKLWRYAWITVESAGDWTMQVGYSNDFQSEVGNSEDINLDPGGAEWGDPSSEWGLVDWGPGEIRQTTRIVLQDTVSESIQFKFSTNVADNWFKVYDILVEYRLRGQRP